MELTNRDRFVRLFQGLPVDRAPFNMVMGRAAQTLVRWADEGKITLDGTDPESRNRAKQRIFEMMGFDFGRGPMLQVNAFVCPEYPEEVIGREGGHTIARTKWGGSKRIPPEGGRMSLQETPPSVDLTRAK